MPPTILYLPCHLATASGLSPSSTSASSSDACTTSTDYPAGSSFVFAKYDTSLDAYYLGRMSAHAPLQTMCPDLVGFELDVADSVDPWICSSISNAVASQYNALVVSASPAYGSSSGFRGVTRPTWQRLSLVCCSSGSSALVCALGVVVLLWTGTEITLEGVGVTCLWVAGCVNQRSPRGARTSRLWTSTLY